MPLILMNQQTKCLPHMCGRHPHRLARSDQAFKIDQSNQVYMFELHGALPQYALPVYFNGLDDTNVQQ